MTRKVLGTRRYELSNHLGNVLTVVTDNIGMSADTTWARVVSASDYYPFGLTMEGRNYQDSLYRYGFNGKEKDDQGEWGSTNYDYGFRIYNPEVGRWLSSDPLAHQYPNYNPYNFALNTPIQAIDPDGALVIFVNGFRLDAWKGFLLRDLNNWFGRTSRPWEESSLYYENDAFKYWGEFDDRYTSLYANDDERSIYVDGMFSPHSTGLSRYLRGIDDAKLY